MHGYAWRSSPQHHAFNETSIDSSSPTALNIQRVDRTYGNDPLSVSMMPFEKFLNQMSVDNQYGSTMFSCPVCHKNFTKKRDFGRHYMIHTGERPYCCSLCPYKSSRLDSLNSHLRLKHSLNPVSRRGKNSAHQ